MGELVPFPSRPAVDNYFGGCPVCGQTDGYINDEREHWFICKAHSAKWCAGSNLFSDWRGEVEADWRRNRALLNTLREVQPLPASDAEPGGCSVCGKNAAEVEALAKFGSPFACCIDAERQEREFRF